MPFFSILLPTKNRANLIGHALQSVLMQSFGNFEIIIADNDDTTATQQEVSKFSDTRIRYFKTGGLSMPDNWEFARTKAQGRFLTVLEDKQAYYQWALERLNKIIEVGNIDVCIWNWDASNKKTENSTVGLDSFMLLSSSFALEQYMSGNLPWRTSPRMLNSCASRELIDRISYLLPGRRFFINYSPDLCAAFSQLALIDNFYYTPSSLGYMTAKVSNATSYRKRKDSVSRYYSGESVIDLSGAVSMVPIKNEFIIHNTVYNDYLRVREFVGGRLNDFTMSSVSYSKMCMHDC